MKAIEPRKEDIFGEVAKVELIITYNNGVVEESYLNMVKESGGWKIDVAEAVSHPKDAYPFIKVSQ